MDYGFECNDFEYAFPDDDVAPFKGTALYFLHDWCYTDTDKDYAITKHSQRKHLYSTSATLRKHLTNFN